MNLTSFTSACILALGASSVSAATVVVDFDTNITRTESYTEDGFQFTANFFDFSVGGGQLFPRFADQRITVSSIDGSTFGVNSLDVFVSSEPSTLRVNGVQAGGDTVDASFEVDNRMFETFTFGEDFANLSSFSFLQTPSLGGSDNLRFTNFVFETEPATAAVPLPAAGWLLLGGVGLMAARRRRG